MEKQIERQPACKPEVGIEKEFLRTTEFFNLEGVTMDIAPPGAVESLDTEAAATLGTSLSMLTKAEMIENNAVDSDVFFSHYSIDYFNTGLLFLYRRNRGNPGNPVFTRRHIVSLLLMMKQVMLCR